MTTVRTDQVPLEDGAMDLHLWIPDGAPGPGLLLIQEIFGVGAYVRAVAKRLAEAGYTVGAPDVFWRFAPGWEAGHDQEGLAASMAQVANLDPQKAIGDCAAGLDHLAAVAGAGRPGVIGFCLGGTLAFGVAIVSDPAVCVSYYGSGVPDMIDRLDHVSCPTLFHFGNDDSYIPGEGVERLAEAIRGRDDVVLNVEHAGHAFDNHESEMFYDESAAQAAWAKTMAFLAEHLPTR
jgi:carboxymethylenebutenolidase